MRLYVGVPDLLLLLAFGCSIVCCFYGRASLYKNLRDRIRGLNPHSIMSFYYLEIQYLRKRDLVGTKRLDFMVAANILAPFALGAFAVYLYWRFF